MTENAANVAENWEVYFDNDSQANYYYNVVTQESSWNRPACIGFNNSHSSSKADLEKEKSKSLIESAFGLESIVTQEDNVNTVTSPPPPSMPSSTRKTHRSVSSFDSNDEYFARLEEEVEAESSNNNEANITRRLAAEERAKQERQAKLDIIEAERLQSIPGSASTQLSKEKSYKDKQLDKIDTMHEIPEEIEYTVQITEDNEPPREIDDDCDLEVVQEQENSNIITESDVEDVVQRNQSAIILQSVHRRRLAQNKVNHLKKEAQKKRYDEFISNNEEKERDKVAVQLKNDAVDRARREAAAIKLQSLHRRISSKYRVSEMKRQKNEDTSRQSSKISTKPPEPSKQSIANDHSAEFKRSKGPRNNPRNAIEEASRYLRDVNDTSPSQYAVPETKSSELKLPDIENNKSNNEPRRRRLSRGVGLESLNKRSMASLEKLEIKAKETAPMESQSVPPNNILPKMHARISQTERRLRKEPLYKRLEAKAKARELEIDKQKRDVWQKIKESKNEAKPSKEAIMSHMQRYVEQRKAHEAKEREFADARKKEWNNNAKLQNRKNKLVRRKKIMDEKENLPPVNENSKEESIRVKAPIKTSPKLKKKKALKPKKLDFIEKEKERLFLEEQAKKERLERGKMYGKVAPSKHMKNASPPRRLLNLIGDPVAQPRGAVVKSIIPSPRSPRQLAGRYSSEDVDNEESRDVITTPKNLIGGKKILQANFNSNQGAEVLSPVLSIPKNKKKSPVDRRSGSLDDSTSSIPNINTPYKGLVGSDWVSQVMEMDVEEATLADVYESGFEMFMIEKGIIQDDLQ